MTLVWHYYLFLESALRPFDGKTEIVGEHVFEHDGGPDLPAEMPAVMQDGIVGEGQATSEPRGPEADKGEQALGEGVFRQAVTRAPPWR